MLADAVRIREELNDESEEDSVDELENDTVCSVISFLKPIFDVTPLCLTPH